MMKIFNGLKKTNSLKILKNRRHSWHSVRYNEFVVNFLEGAILENKRAVGRTGLQYLKQVARNRAAVSCTAIGRAVCNNSTLNGRLPNNQKMGG